MTAAVTQNGVASFVAGQAADRSRGHGMSVHRCHGLAVNVDRPTEPLMRPGSRSIPLIGAYAHPSRDRPSISSMRDRIPSSCVAKSSRAGKFDAPQRQDGPRLRGDGNAAQCVDRDVHADPAAVPRPASAVSGGLAGNTSCYRGKCLLRTPRPKLL